MYFAKNVHEAFDARINCRHLFFCLDLILLIECNSFGVRIFALDIIQSIFAFIITNAHIESHCDTGLISQLTRKHVVSVMSNLHHHISHIFCNSSLHFVIQLTRFSFGILLYVHVQSFLVHSRNVLLGRLATHWAFL